MNILTLQSILAIILCFIMAKTLKCLQKNLNCIIDHGNGYWTLYGHSQYMSVTQGQHVNKGDVLGIVGSTGYSTGDHLHFEVIMLTISGFKVYDQMYMITQGGPGTATMTLVYYIYNVAFVNTPKYGYASAIAMVLFVLVLIVTIIQFRGSKGDN